MKRLVAGHDAALNALMERHGERLFHYLVRCLPNEDEAADLAKETFVRVYQHRAKFDARQKAVEMRIYRARQQLRESLGALLETL